MRALLSLAFVLLPCAAHAAELSHYGGELDNWLSGPAATGVEVGGTVIPTPIRVVPPKMAPLVVRAPVQVHVSGGPHWTHPDTIRNHLMSTHGYSAAQLAGLSHEQMLSMHDADHNSGKFRVHAAPQSVQYASSGCPGGVCPSQKRRHR